jgi:predicted  nucleic acid-binding Zn-ribbon protein
LLQTQLSNDIENWKIEIEDIEGKTAKVSNELNEIERKM